MIKFNIPCMMRIRNSGGEVIQPDARQAASCARRSQPTVEGTAVAANLFVEFKRCRR